MGASTYKAIHAALITAVLVAAVAKAAINCNTVTTYLRPCVPYVTNRGQLGGCCGGVTRLHNAARTTADRRAVCNCLQSLAAIKKGFNLNRVAGIPTQCGLNIPYRISPSTVCSRVS